MLSPHPANHPPRTRQPHGELVTLGLTKQEGSSVIAADYPFLDVVWTMFIFFAWVIWFWLLITVFGDVFRRHDISGWTKTLWILFAIVTPFLGVFVYLISQGKGMAERNTKAVQIAKAKQLLDSGAINAQEFEALKQKALAA